jgi:hypothetical protein
MRPSHLNYVILFQVLLLLLMQYINSRLDLLLPNCQAMATEQAAVRLWETALKQLDKLPAGLNTSETDQQHQAATAATPVPFGHLPQATEFFELPKINPAAWSKLFADLKVKVALPTQLHAQLSQADAYHIYVAPPLLVY